MTLTIRQALERMFPLVRTAGDRSEPNYLQWPRGQSRRPPPTDAYANPPLTPFDVFAITAHLLETSGAYHHIWAKSDGRAASASDRTPSRRRIVVETPAIDECKAIAKAWRAPLGELRTANELTRRLAQRLRNMPKFTERWFELFVTHGNQPLFAPSGYDEPPPHWWRTAHELFMIADEACIGVGFNSFGVSAGNTDDVSDMPWFEALLVGQSLPEVGGEFDATELQVKGFKTLSMADPNIACVLPKGRTTPVGCTMRSLSHHLALLPAQGVARARWYHPVPGDTPSDATELNVLLVPFPFALNDTDFSGVAPRSDIHQNWGFFHVHQSWLPRRDDDSACEAIVHELALFIKALARTATRRHGARGIDAVILPELALSHEVYHALLVALKDCLPGLEMVIAGLSSNGQRSGNFVAVTMLEKDDFAGLTAIREKHHRWRLDGNQIRDYGLTGGLNPRFQWWEDLDLLSRRVDFTTFRRRSVLAAMICEDLARVDPCQELLRAIGPNLIVALLMDAPQLETRWPARYATVLAEDPGSSVLTLTSNALMNRQHKIGSKPSVGAHDRVIALWRDDSHARPRAICCPDDAQGVWLKLWTSSVTDASLDGRLDSFGKTWTYGKDVALAIEDAHELFKGILAPRSPT